MTLLLVDERDGRIVAQLWTLEQARRILDGWVGGDDDVPGYLCLVELQSRPGAIVGTDSSVTIRPLS